MFKKKILAVTIASASLVMSAGAFAGTWTATAGAPEFASEILDADVTLTPTDAVYEMETTPGGGAAFNITFTLTGGTFDSALATGDLVFDDADTSGSDASVVLVEGGAAGSTSAKFRVDVLTGITVDDTFTLTYDLNGGTLGTAKLAVSLTDNLGAVDTAGVATTVATSAPGTTIEFTAGTPGQIDVADESLTFVGGSTSEIIGTLLVEDTGSVESDGATMWEADVSGEATVATATLTITGDFTAADDVTVDGVSADDITDTTATFEDVDVAALVAAGVVDVVLEVTGEDAIAESTYSATLAIDWDDADRIDTTESGDLAELSKNGDSVDLDLLLTPGGVFSNYLRITNKSSIAGSVFITLFNDAGDSVSIDLGDVEGQETDLPANGSSPLMTIVQVYAAAQEVDPDFMADGGKLRAVIDAEVSDIEAQALTLATDNTTFSAF